MLMSIIMSIQDGVGLGHFFNSSVTPPSEEPQNFFWNQLKETLAVLHSLMGKDKKIHNACFLLHSVLKSISVQNHSG